MMEFDNGRRHITSEVSVSNDKKRRYNDDGAEHNREYYDRGRTREDNGYRSTKFSYNMNEERNHRRDSERSPRDHQIDSADGHFNDPRNSRDVRDRQRDFDDDDRYYSGRRHDARTSRNDDADYHRENYDDSRQSRRRRFDDDDRYDNSCNRNERWRQAVPTATVMVKMLPSHVDEQHLRQILEIEWQQRALIRVPRPLDGGGALNRGFGFIEFPSIADATQWLEQHDGTLHIDDTRCYLSYCHGKQHGTASSTSNAGSTGINDQAVPSENVAAANGGGWICESCSAYNYAYRHNCFRCKSGGNTTSSTQSVAATEAANFYDPAVLQNEELTMTRMLAADPRKLIRLNDNTDTLLLRNLNPTTTDEAARRAIEQYISASRSSLAISVVAVKAVAAADEATNSEERGHRKKDSVHRRDDNNDNNSKCYCFVQLKSVEHAQALHRLLFRTPLEIDGFRITVVYSAVSVLAAFPSLARQQPLAFANQSDLANVAAATAQAALSRVNQTKSAAGVTGSAASVAGDTSDCVFDAASGYYFYKTSGLYYHPDTRLFYNAQTQQYLYFDAATNKYLPYECAVNAAPQAAVAGVAAASNASTKEEEEEDDKARAQRVAREMEQWAKKQAQEQSSSSKPRTAISVSVSKMTASATGQSVDKKGSSKVAADVVCEQPPRTVAKPSCFAPEGEEEKPTVVHDIDSMLSVASNMPRMRFGNAAGDAGCYGARKYMSRKRDEFKTPVRPGVECQPAPESVSPITQQLPTTASLPAAMATPSSFADYANLICTLCDRKFKSVDILDKHTTQSALHKQNLDSLAARQEQATPGASNSVSTSVSTTLQYRDRAAERRKEGGVADEPPLYEDRKFQHTAMLRDAYYSAATSLQNPKSAANDVSDNNGKPQPLSSDNVGCKMLKMMNWQEGRGLGARQQGMVDPLEAKATTGRRGLGINSAREDEGPKYDAGDSYAMRMKKLAQHRYRELEEK